MNEPINGETKQYYSPWNCVHGRTTQATYCMGTNKWKNVCEKPFIEFVPKPGEKYYYHDYLQDFGYSENGKQNYEECKTCKYFAPRHTPRICRYSSIETYESTCGECGAVKIEKKFFCTVKSNHEISENGEQCFDCDRFER